MAQPWDPRKGDGTYVENRPSKMAQTWDIVRPYITGPVDGFWNLMESPAASGGPITPEDAANAFMAAGGAMAGGALAPKPKNALNMGIRVYHSSPYDFDKFDLSHMGKGEGAQVYTKGHYFAESPAVSGQGGHYWNAFTSHPAISPPERVAANALQFTGFDRPKAIEELRIGNENVKARAAAEPSDPRYSQLDLQQQEALRLLETGQPVGPRTYEVEIDANPKNFIQWEAPVNEQPAAVRQVLSDMLERAAPGGFQPFSPDTEIPFVQWYRGISRPINQMVTGFRPGRMEEEMAKAGVPGVKYLDGLSRFKGDGSSNYVVYRDDLLKIVKKYGMAGLLAAGGGAALTNDDEALADVIAKR